jgi:hypothetical protein
MIPKLQSALVGCLVGACIGFSWGALVGSFASDGGEDYFLQIFGMFVTTALVGLAVGAVAAYREVVGVFAALVIGGWAPVALTLLAGRRLDGWIIIDLVYYAPSAVVCGIVVGAITRLLARMGIGRPIRDHATEVDL